MNPLRFVSHPHSWKMNFSRRAARWAETPSGLRCLEGTPAVLQAPHAQHSSTPSAGSPATSQPRGPHPGQPGWAPTGRTRSEGRGPCPESPTSLHRDQSWAPCSGCVLPRGCGHTSFLWSPSSVSLRLPREEDP